MARTSELGGSELDEWSASFCQIYHAYEDADVYTRTIGKPLRWFRWGILFLDLRVLGVFPGCFTVSTTVR